VRTRFVTLAARALLLAGFAAAQDDDAVSRWGKSTGDALVHFLPNAAPWGLSPDPSLIFNGFANDTPHKYMALVVHKLWWFDDPELSRQIDQVRQERKSLEQEGQKSMEEWNKVHGAEYRTLNKELMDLAQQLAKQGKYLDLSKRGQNSQADAILQKIDAIRPPLASFDKRQEVFKEREDLLTGHRRQVSFRIYTTGRLRPPPLRTPRSPWAPWRGILSIDKTAEP
jgi:hypothetical protein